jgi:hypothetical protein
MQLGVVCSAANALGVLCPPRCALYVLVVDPLQESGQFIHLALKLRDLSLQAGNALFQVHETRLRHSSAVKTAPYRPKRYSDSQAASGASQQDPRRSRRPPYVPRVRAAFTTQRRSKAL